MKKLSIVTINFNNAVGLQQTIESVISQTFKNYEYIIIDGRSEDGSVDVIKKYEDQISYWTSEPNKGIYGNMNRGIKEIKGEYSLFLNSGDWLSEPTILEQVFAQQPTADIVSGDIIFYDNDKGEIKWQVASPDPITARPLFMGTLPHQATFIKSSLFEQFGPYSEKLKITSDWLFFLEVLLEKGCSYQHIKLPVAYFSMNGISCDPKTDSLPRREQLGILREKYPLFLQDYEYLDQLEKTHRQWLDSREYKVYTFFKRTGIISLGVFFYRVLRFVKRKVFRSN